MTMKITTIRIDPETLRLAKLRAKKFGLRVAPYIRMCIRIEADREKETKTTVEEKETRDGDL